jgi:exopolysaccharide biosynthesis polyprenyl glycosylphosphotransferase
MAQTANIFDVVGLRRPPVPIAAVPLAYLEIPASARLIPGASNLSSATPRENSQSVRKDGSGMSPSQSRPSVLASAAVRLRPQFLKQFHPAMLGVAILDVTTISLVFILEFTLLVSRGALLQTPPLGATTFAFFMASFLLFAIQEGLYRNCRKTLWVEWELAAKAVLWTTLLTSAALNCSSSRPPLLPVLFLGGLSTGGLCATRRILKAVPGAGATGDHRNVLIIGAGSAGQNAASAIQSDSRPTRSVKGVLAENRLRGIHGPAMLRTIAREECIDEVIIATRDSEVAQAAIREALRNRLDVRVVPDLFGSDREASELENLAGVPLVKIYEQVLPEWTLAVKRIADVVVAATGLVALSPLMLAIAVAIKVNSAGPVVYRAVRVGRKKRKFTCYKFRTMVPEADAAKEELRARNERDGAFFKISDDPRITRAGRFLRRYSLDELPQLWNVLRGEMSLVGPRPHPPDDVERYCVEHLQRLDFVPGITGLWQVTARRDSSFERCVTLDVEYIQRWSLALDLQILWKTIPAVFQGSGV